MIPYNFEYYQPVTALEGVRLFHDLALQGKEPMYYAGGTEIITMGRTLPVQPRAVIDIKKNSRMHDPCRPGSKAGSRIGLESVPAA